MRNEEANLETLFGILSDCSRISFADATRKRLPANRRGRRPISLDCNKKRRVFVTKRIFQLPMMANRATNGSMTLPCSSRPSSRM